MTTRSQVSNHRPRPTRLPPSLLPASNKEPRSTYTGASPPQPLATIRGLSKLLLLLVCDVATEANLPLTDGVPPHDDSQTVDARHKRQTGDFDVDRLAWHFRNTNWLISCKSNMSEELFIYGRNRDRQIIAVTYIYRLLIY